MLNRVGNGASTLASRQKSTNSVIYLIFDVKVGPGLAEDLHNTREAVPHSNVETGLLVLRIDKQKNKN
jgi:hypothetical protein